MKTTIAINREHIVNRATTSESYSRGRPEVYRATTRTALTRVTETLEVTVVETDQTEKPKPKYRPTPTGVTPYQLPLGM